MKILGKKFCLFGFALLSVVFLCSCGEEQYRSIKKEKQTVSAEKKAIAKTKKLAEHINNTESKLKMKPIAEMMQDDFEFNDGSGKVYKGSNKSVGGRPYFKLYKMEGFISYEQGFTDSRSLGSGTYEVSVIAKLEAKNPTGVVKISEWPITFRWFEEKGKLYLASVKYEEKMKWKNKNPEPKDPPARAYATQKAATTIEQEVDRSSSASTNTKVKKHIKSQIDALNQKNKNR